ncbi:hypothetical protein ABIE67_004068 [Streptomyces sp. V4I8]
MVAGADSIDALDVLRHGGLSCLSGGMRVGRRADGLRRPSARVAAGAEVVSADGTVSEAGRVSGDGGRLRPPYSRTSGGHTLTYATGRTGLINIALEKVVAAGLEDERCPAGGAAAAAGRTRQRRHDAVQPVEAGRRFGPPSGNDPKLDDPFGRYVLTTIVKGTSMGLYEAAKHIPAVSGRRVQHARTRHRTRLVRPEARRRPHPAARRGSERRRLGPGRVMPGAPAGTTRAPSCQAGWAVMVQRRLVARVRATYKSLSPPGRAVMISSGFMTTTPSNSRPRASDAGTMRAW